MGSAIQDTKKDKAFKALVLLFLTAALLIVLYPLIYIISASISNPSAVNTGEMWLFPKEITLEGYKLIFQNDDIWRGYLNTILYTVLGTVINLGVTIPAAYALSRKDLAGRNLLMGMFVLTMFFSGGLIPTYLVVKSLGLIDTIWAMVLPNAAAVWNIVIARVFFQTSIPKGLEEAAIIDGASNFKLFTKIILPLSAPIIAVMALFYGVGHWNSYFNALIYLSDKEMYPLQLVLREILVLQEMASQNTNMTGSMAEAMHSKQQLAAIVKYGVMIVSSLPVIIVYPFLQRYFVKGVLIGSLKG
ncbi:carbohydrate ABC transporter permease [Virgibacillus sp. AGTR]|uniref:Carbohydrate ABC transporter permease n=1 Tax=Virgibacillus salarius TaxID=447199 RepID=A0A941IAV8_9BACI|nr:MULTISPECIES: carbohydrate ABC transporter permease [Virgibacillus]NAZ08479.1 ABC transporter permease subunit [Agaribacter marinus]MBR7795766.1 carbohydrate ABC transporter permease [Virgibacillus salarius]MCC2248652.1 carbohydrate ABC transporter permease [Virgibacillus sp. AGTR]MDY7045881.1 carbohydrate ABC transporter permease [Virgibacillus sp. M23]QRZ18406.1 carbohydrate ABC transporter permease [Virgibacillus sp. AGTR]